MANIATPESTWPVYRLYCAIDRFAGRFNIRTKRCYAQYATAAGEYLRVAIMGTRMKDLGSICRRPIEAVDGQTDVVAVRISGRCHHYAQRTALVPADLDVCNMTIERRVAQCYKIRIQSHQNRLGFRVTEAAVKFKHPWYVILTDHQTSIEETGVRNSFASQAIDGRFYDLLENALIE